MFQHLPFCWLLKLTYAYCSGIWKFCDLRLHQKRVFTSLTLFSVLAFLRLLRLLECLILYMYMRTPWYGLYLTINKICGNIQEIFKVTYESIQWKLSCKNAVPNWNLKHLKDTPKAFNDFKNKQKSVWSNVFWYMKACIFWKYIQYTLPWDKTQLLKNFTSKKINFTNNTLFFLSIVPTHHCFTFGLRLIYELKHSSRFVSL